VLGVLVIEVRLRCPGGAASYNSQIIINKSASIQVTPCCRRDHAALRPLAEVSHP
jgi:hypothetical protein